jgi:hypothetical protein
MTSQFELAGPVPVAPLQSVPAAETARIVAVASDDMQNFRTLGMMSSLDGGAADRCHVSITLTLAAENVSL